MDDDEEESVVVVVADVAAVERAPIPFFLLEAFVFIVTGSLILILPLRGRPKTIDDDADDIQRRKKRTRVLPKMYIFIRVVR